MNQVRESAIHLMSWSSCDERGNVINNFLWRKFEDNIIVVSKWTKIPCSNKSILREELSSKQNATPSTIVRPYPLCIFIDLIGVTNMGIAPPRLLISYGEAPPLCFHLSGSFRPENNEEVRAFMGCSWTGLVCLWYLLLTAQPFLPDLLFGLLIRCK